MALPLHVPLRSRAPAGAGRLRGRGCIRGVPARTIQLLVQVAGNASATQRVTAQVHPGQNDPLFSPSMRGTTVGAPTLSARVRANRLTNSTYRRPSWSQA